MTEDWLLQTPLHNETNVLKKMCQHPLWGEHTVRIAVKKLLLIKQNNVKGFQWAKAYKDLTIELWNKVLWTDKSKFEIFVSNRRVYVLRRVSERVATHCTTLTVKHIGFFLCCGWLLPIAKLVIYTKWKANRIRQAIITYCSIMPSHMEHGLWVVKDLYSWPKVYK